MRSSKLSSRDAFRSSKSRHVPTLHRFCSPLAAWLQLICLACWIALPPQQSHAGWVPDENGNPSWLSFQGESQGNGPEMNDSDGNGIPDWMDAFNAACAVNTITFWAGGTYIVDGVSTTYGGVWHATSGDTDGDLIPDDLDPYPNDSANNSFYWSGGSFTISSITHAFRSGWYAGSPNDGDGNGVPDCLDDWFINPSAHGTVQHWAGGIFKINNEESMFEPVNYYASSYTDADADGIPDELDPYPSDPWNNTSFMWQGGDFVINGVSTHFPPATYGGEWVDADHDLIPDQADPLPADEFNNSAWWQGGWYTIDGAGQTFAAQWHRADAGDSDGDGIPDDIDPLPASAANIHTTFWAGGTFWFSNQQLFFPAGDYPGNGTDSDGDGVPDSADYCPNDPSNGNVSVEYTWPGGVFQIDNQSQSIAGGTYSGSWTDSDGDGIPDPADPYPAYASNGNSYFQWSGGWYLFNNQNTWFAPGEYAGSATDSDGDGVPDGCDLYPDDANNGNATYSWPGGTFRIADGDVPIAGGTFPGLWADSDADGIPDAQDPYPADASNHNTVSTTFHWAGGNFRINNADHFFPEDDYDGTWADADADGIPDSLDGYPTDPANGNTTFVWAGGTFRIDNGGHLFADGTYPGVWADGDGDGIPDSLDPYPTDSANGNTTFYWAGGTFRIDSQSQTFSAGYYDGELADEDGDGIPDSLDVHLGDPGNGNTQFHWQGGYFVVHNQGVLFAEGDYDGVFADNDSDGLPDSLDAYPGDPANGNTTVEVFFWQGGAFYVNGIEATWVSGDYPGTWADTDGDGIPDSLDLHPEDATNNTTFWDGGDFTIDGFAVHRDGQYHRTNAPDTDGDGMPDDVDPYPTDAANHPAFDWPAVDTDFTIDNQVVTFHPAHYGVNWADADEDGIPDIADPHPLDGYNGNDTDSDGIPDSVEALYPSILDINSPGGASAVRGDGLTYLQAYQMYPSLPLDQNLDPALDSDHDGIPDVVEVAHGLNPFQASDAAGSKMGDFVTNLEKYQLGLDLEVAITQSEYENVTGQLWDQFLLNHNQLLADAEDDPDGDGVSNIDELLLFYTNPRDGSSRPNDESILSAILNNQVSATTLINYNSLVNTGGGSTDGEGGTSGGDGSSTGGTGSSTGGEGGTGGDAGGTGGESGTNGSISRTLFKEGMYFETKRQTYVWTPNASTSTTGSATTSSTGSWQLSTSGGNVGGSTTTTSPTNQQSNTSGQDGYGSSTSYIGTKPKDFEGYIIDTLGLQFGGWIGAIEEEVIRETIVSDFTDMGVRTVITTKIVKWKGSCEVHTSSN